MRFFLAIITDDIEFENFTFKKGDTVFFRLKYKKVMMMEDYFCVELTINKFLSKAIPILNSSRNKFEYNSNANRVAISMIRYIRRRDEKESEKEKKR